MQDTRHKTSQDDKEPDRTKIKAIVLIIIVALITYLSIVVQIEYDKDMTTCNESGYQSYEKGYCIKEVCHIENKSIEDIRSRT